jgi:hypothetical protein
MGPVRMAPSPSWLVEISSSRPVGVMPIPPAHRHHLPRGPVARATDSVTRAEDTVEMSRGSRAARWGASEGWPGIDAASSSERDAG